MYQDKPCFLQNLDILAGSHQAKFGVLPSGKRFRSADLPGVSLDNELEIRFELVVFYRLCHPQPQLFIFFGIGKELFCTEGVGQRVLYGIQIALPGIIQRGFRCAVRVLRQTTDTGGKNPCILLAKLRQIVTQRR